jgi:chromosome segregation ATPase
VNWDNIIRIVGFLFAVVGGTGGAVAFVKARGEVRKLDADAISVINETAGKAVERAERQVEQFESQVQRLRDQLAASSLAVENLQTQVQILTQRIHQAQLLLEQHNITVPWNT